MFGISFGEFLEGLAKSIFITVLVAMFIIAVKFGCEEYIESHPDSIWCSSQTSDLNLSGRYEIIEHNDSFYKFDTETGTLEKVDIK